MVRQQAVSQYLIGVNNMGTKNLNSATDLITFTRASGGTALRKISYGSELVTNGTFDTDLSGWTANSFATLSLSSGSIRVENNSNNLGLAIQEIDLEAGKTYHFSTNLIAINDLLAQFTVNTSTNYSTNVAGLTNSSTTGTKTFNYTPSSSGTYYIILAHRGGNILGKYVEFDNVSVKEVLFDQADGTLQLWNHGNNVPRIEYDATGAVKGLLIEEARTNYYPTSTDTWTAYGNGTHVKTVDSSVVNPTGAYGSDKITHTNNFGYSYVGYHGTYATVGTRETYSAYLKSAGHNHVRFRMSNMNGHVNYDFDLSNGNSSLPAIAINSGTTGHIEDVGNGWWRCSMTYTALSANPYPSIFLMPSADNFDITQFQGDGTSGVYMWGHQIETGAFPTSYIPTTGSTATRAADFAQIPTSAFGYNNDKGSLVIDVLTPVADQFMALAHFNTSSYFNSRALWKGNNLLSGAGDYFFFQTYDGAVTNIVLGQQTQAGYTKLGLSYGDSERAVKDGGTVASGTSRYPSPTRLFLGGRDNGYQSQCWIKSIKYYPRSLTNTQLQELTT